MVGVAGRSKGCATCRRRKVKCDEGQPSCSRCSKAGIVCAGYDKYAVFIRKGVDGWEKRQPLEETRVRDPATYPAASCEKISYPAATTALELKSVAVEAAPFMDHFFRNFVVSPKVGFLKQDYIDPETWTYGLKFVKGSESLLHNALVAVSMAYCGKKRRDLDLLLAGRAWYSHSLCQLCHLLGNEESRLDDEVLVSTSVCMAYETIDPSDPKSSAGWVRHLGGITRLIYHRGPNSFGQTQSRDVLEDTRHMLMMSGLMRRKSSFLIQTPWMTEPWRNTTKSVQQQVVDCGLLLGNVFAQMDSLPAEETSSTQARDLMNQCLRIDNKLQVLAIQIPAMLEAGNRFEEPQATSSDQLPNATMFHAANHLRLRITIIGIRLRIYETMSALVQHFNLSENILHSMPDGRHRKALAVSALDLVKCYLSLDVGSVAKGRHVFALERVKAQLGANEPELSKCEELLRVVQDEDFEKRGKSFAGEPSSLPADLKERNYLDSWCIMVTAPRRTSILRDGGIERCM